MLLTQLLKASFQSQRMQEHSVHDTENRAVRADAERQREHGNESKAGTARFDKTRRLNRLEQFSSRMNLHLYKGCEIKVAFDLERSVVGNLSKSTTTETNKHPASITFAGWFVHSQICRQISGEVFKTSSPPPRSPEPVVN